MAFAHYAVVGLLSAVGGESISGKVGRAPYVGGLQRCNKGLTRETAVNRMHALRGQSDSDFDEFVAGVMGV